MRWAGFRRVRRQVCKRINRRLAELDLPDLKAYTALLESEAREWDRLVSLCRVTISRFYRDCAVWDYLGDILVPELARLARQRGDRDLRCWSIGCASGEEPYTLSMVWRWKTGVAAQLRLRIVATEVDECLLERARRGVYGRSSLRHLPRELRCCFTPEGERYRIDPAHRELITFACQDVRQDLSDEDFHLVLCRNLVFTYYDESLQRQLLDRLAQRLVPGGALVIGIHEILPAYETALAARDEGLGIYVRVPLVSSVS